ncbi:hypothetical protein [Anaerocolumna jejuensis]|uniref:hypothetical protein n=1 Tax=Anaerocolumna jejuensis TaxID=259063 RepID=UPI003F7C7CFA
MNELFEKAYEEVQQTASLILPTRKKIWTQLGNISYEPGIRKMTDGIRKRVTLAKAYVKKVLPRRL